MKTKERELTRSVRPEVAARRKADHPINPIFLNRWSPRAMSGKPLERAVLDRLFEAARWAPSSYNSQPWRFVYGLRGTPAFQKLYGLLVDFNKSWAKDAGALILLVSRTHFEDDAEPAPTHSLDTGAAWMSMALEASFDGLVIHGMQGFDYGRARAELGIPDDYKVEAMIAVGRPGDAQELPEGLKRREVPSGRKPISELAFEGRFSQSKH